MEFSRDFADLFRILDAAMVRYLVVGSQAVAVHSVPRFTKDLDVWIPRELNDGRVVHGALKRFGAPLRGVKPADFEDPKVVY